jgi:hypothetical protein
MFCPNCRAEYRKGATICSDCQVALVDQLPGKPPAEADILSEDEPLVAVWGCRDPQEHAEVIASLEKENIPTRTVQADDYLFIPRTRLPFEIYVPKRFAEKAKQILDPDVNSSEETFKNKITAPPEEILEEDSTASLENVAERGEWHPDDATAEIWSGEDAGMADMIRMSLRENQIPCRVDSGEGQEEMETSTESVTKVFVLPEDEKRAQEIVREILNSSPLQ